MSSCILCDVITGSAAASMVAAEPGAVAFLDIRPVNPGHVLVVPRRHVASLQGLSDADGEAMMRLARHLASALRISGLRCEGVSLWLADGEAAGQEVLHAHLHVVPRFAGDGFGLRFPAGYGRLQPRQALEETAERIRAALPPGGGEPVM